MKHMKKLCALGLVMMMSVATVAPAYAVNSANGDINPGDNTTSKYTYKAPTTPMAVDSSVVTASAHRAASPLLGILGVNATSGFGMINGAAPSDLASAQECPAMGIWGSELNSNPDPYYWNYFYNYYAKENGLETVTESVYGGNALRNDNVAASPAQADTTLFEEYGNLSVSLASRPEVLIGVGATKDKKDYTEQLNTIKSFVERNADGSLKYYKESELPENAVLYNTDSSKYTYTEGRSYKKVDDGQYIQILSKYYQNGDETYNPKQVTYGMTTIADMITTVKDAADAVTEVEKEKGKTTRYDNVETIASDYESYIYGIISYVQSQLAAKGQKQKTFAFVTDIKDDGTFELGGADYNSATSVGRAYEYCIAAATPMTKETKSVTLDELLKADVIITLNNKNITSEKMAAAGVDSETYKGILITNNPASLYGITMNSVENAIGYAYVIGSMYSDVLDIDPVDLAAYFYEHFEHITDADSLATVVTTNFSAVNLPDGVSADTSDYSSSKVEDMLETGMRYYSQHETEFDGDAFKDSGIDKWTPDYTQGIGSKVVYGTPVFNWGKDGKTATATFKQVNGKGDAEKTVAAKITSKVTKAATYTTKGETTYTATVTDPSSGKEYTDTKTVADIPVKARTNVSKAKITLAKTAYTYNGKAQKPAVTVKVGSKKLKAGTDYTVSYASNKNIGTAKVTVKGKGAYTGTKTATFKINPKATSVTKTKNSKKGAAAINWKKVSGVTGYQVRYAVKGTSSWKTVTVKGASASAKTVAKLKKGKTYKFQVRTYKKVSSKNYYSAWSASKSLKITK